MTMSGYGHPVVLIVLCVISDVPLFGDARYRRCDLLAAQHPDWPRSAASARRLPVRLRDSMPLAGDSPTVGNRYGIRRNAGQLDVDLTARRG